jgi:hypothetical protein
MLEVMREVMARVVGLVAGRGAGDVNRTAARFAVHATDLGILWRDSRGRVAIAFGDTYGAGWGGRGAGPGTADWRCNTLAHAAGTAPSGGLRIASMVTDRPGHAAQVLARDPDVPEVTVIPTAAIAAGGADHLHYMSVRSWGTGGRWTTNYSGLAVSVDGGRTWAKPASARWPTEGGGGGFQLGALARRGPHVHLFGTPAGRLGDARLARVRATAVARLPAYEYWTGGRWSAAVDDAAPVMPGPVGELSVQYNTALRRWVALHLDEHRAAIVVRTAPAATGPWTAGRVAVDGTRHPGLYGAFLHPDSARSRVLHFTMSCWDPYHVLLMELPLG